MEGVKKKNKRIFYLMLGISILLIGGMSATFAYFNASKSNTGTISGTTNNTNGILTINVARLSLNPSPEPSSDALIPAGFGVTPDNITTTLVNNALTAKCAKNGYTGCHVWKITASTTQTVSTANIRLSLTLPTVVDKNEWSYVVYTGSDSASSNIVYKGRIIESFPNDVTTLDIHNGGGLTANTAQVYYVMVYLNNVSSVQNDGVTEGTTNATGRYNGSVTLEAMGGQVRANFLEDAAQYITNLYTNNKSGTVTVNSITYNLAPSVNLMNDRHASMSVGADAGDIRYYGANPNNYVDIGDRTSNDKVILWRIIGVFDGKLRIVRNEAIGKYPYDTSASTVNSGQGVNEWSQADSMKLLNPGYDNEAIGGSLWYKSGSGSCYFGQNNGTTECDFTSTGLSNKSKDYIIDQTVYLGSGDDSSIYPDQAYIMERGNSVRTCTDAKTCNDTVERTSSWTGKVALMYPSDYGYAVDLRVCKKTLYAYNDSTCTNNNWLKTPIGWLMTPYISDNYRMWAVVYAGSVSRGRAYYSDYYVRPVVTLKANIMFESGTGTSTDPFVVA